MKTISLTFLVVLCFTVNAQINPLDSTYGNSGTVFLPLSNDEIYSCEPLVQTDGKVVLAGGPYVARFHQNGDLDTSFASGGVLTDTNWHFTVIKQLPNGQLVIGGQVNNSPGYSLAVLSLNANGVLDTSFGNAGISGIRLPNARLNDIIINNNRIEAYGTMLDVAIEASNYVVNPKSCMAVMDMNGQLDTSFGGVYMFNPIPFGWVLVKGIKEELGPKGISNVIADKDIRYLLGSADGEASAPVGTLATYNHHTLTLFKHDTLGQVDTITFYGSDFYSTQGWMKPSKMAFQGSKLVCAGFKSNSAPAGQVIPLQNEFYLMRFTDDGKVDSTFGINGTVMAYIGNEAMLNDIRVLPNNHIVVIGSSYNTQSQQNELVISKFTPDGQLDPTCYGAINYGTKVSTITQNRYVYQRNRIVKIEGNHMLVATVNDTSGTYGFQLTSYLINSGGNLKDSAICVFNYNSNIYSNSGIYYDTLTNIYGCDSIVMLDIKILPGVITQTDSVVACKSYAWRNGVTYNQTGNYSDTLSLVNGCDSIFTLHLFINSADDSVTQTGITLTAYATNASYQWLDCNTMLPIVGETNQSFTPDQNGDYAVIVTENGCTDTSDCYAITNIGMEEWNSSWIQVYPNPNDGHFKVDLGTLIGKTTIQLFTIKGQLLYQKEALHNGPIHINANQPKGIYILRISNGQDVNTKRVLIQ